MMSSTLRGAHRLKWDYYITPQYAIKDFLGEFIYHEDLNENMSILDPCAGGDAVHEMSYPTVLNKMGFKFVSTCDIREDSRAKAKHDYLNLELSSKMDMIITNPPFDQSIPIIEKAINDVRDGGFVVMLQRLNFLGGITYKKEFWDRVGLPKYIFVHRKRMSFTEDGKTDSIEYAHYVWEKGLNPKFSKTMIV